MVAIFVVLTILACLSIDALIEKHRASQTATQAITSPVNFWEIPEQTHLFPGHTWVELNNAPTHGVRVGLDAFLTHFLGQIDQIDPLPVGTHLTQGDPMLSVIKEGRQFTLQAPISGEIEACNSEVTTHPNRLQKTAYNDGWIYKLRPSLYLSEDQRVLQTGHRAQLWLESEYRRLANWLTLNHTLRTEWAMQDGGMPAPGVLAYLDGAEWADFQTQFLNQPHA